MKAAQYDTSNSKVVVNNVPIPEPGEGQVLIKVAAASLCHSDLMHEFRPADLALTMGHEGVGIVEKIHPSAEGKEFKVGDKVGCLYINDCCFECESCQAHGTQCERPKRGGAKIMGLTGDGFFAEYALVDVSDAWECNDSTHRLMSPNHLSGKILLYCRTVYLLRG